MPHPGVGAARGSARPLGANMVVGTFDSELKSLLAGLRAAPTFEEAADALLDAIIALVAPANTESRSLLRCGVTLHGARGLRGSVIRGLATPSAVEGRPPSRTAIRMLEELGEPVFINVGRCQVEPARWDHGGAPRPDTPELPEPRAVTGATRTLLAASDASHIYALPLRRGARMEGLVTLEWRALSELREPLSAWEALAEGVSLLVDVAAHAVLALPFAEVPNAGARLGVPVVGATMRPVLAQLDRFARGSGTVLLGGPTGAGKSTLARWVHDRSPRARGPFRTLQLQTLPAEEMSAYLFGWERGAFTGAVDRYGGEVAQAEGGTLFLDEVQLLHLDAQGQLLQFLLTRRYRRRGHTGEDASSDVRIVAATNEDLERAVSERRFREDLYLRLAQRAVDVPGLDERRDEIPEWARLLLRRYHQKEGGQGDVDLSADAVVALCAHPWPGSLHALDNAVCAARDLAASEGRDGPLVVEVQHVLDALRPRRRRAGESKLEAAMAGAVNAWLDGLEAAPPPEALAWSSAKGLFRSHLLLAAVARWGLREAFARLGEERRVASGNHSKEVALARECVAEFEGRLRARLNPTM